MAAEGEFPKADGDVLYASEANQFAGFGDGSDGAFNETAASTTNLTQGTVYQYTTFNLGSAHTISASSTSQYPIFIYVQGNCTIDGTIDLNGKGYNGTYEDLITEGSNSTTTAGAAGGDVLIKFLNFEYNQPSLILNGTKGGSGSTSQGGGGGGASPHTDGSNGTNGSSGSGGGTNGTPGNGGCTLVMIIGGTLTFGASSSIDCGGADGGDGTGDQGAGAGGGGGGDILIFHKGTKTDNGVTTSVAGGSGGSGTSFGGAGGNGGNGQELIVNYDTIFWR